MKHSKYLTTANIALISVFSALYCILSLLPGIKIAAGSANVSIQIEALMASIFGLVMGPYLGAITAFMGAFLAWLLPPGSPTVTSAIFLPSPVINALVVGLIYTRRWKTAFATLAVVIAVFWCLPATQPWDQNSYIGFFAMWDKIVALALILPTAVLLNRVLKQESKAPEDAEGLSMMKKIDLSILFSFAAAILVLINAWVIGSGGDVKIEFNLFETSFKTRLVSKEWFQMIASLGYAWLSLGIGILMCCALFYLKPQKRVIWGALVFLLSSLSSVIGGGYFAGLFLGVLGGILGILRRKHTLPKAILHGELLLFFMLAFIGNEADNALGNDVFAVPIVYEKVYGMPLVVLRGLFIVSPFFFFAVRLLQAAITALVATPLLRNLRAAGFNINPVTEAKDTGNLSSATVSSQ